MMLVGDSIVSRLFFVYVLSCMQQERGVFLNLGPRPVEATKVLA